MTNAKASNLLRNGAALMLTYTTQGALFSIDGHGAVAAKYARALTRGIDLDGPSMAQAQADLFLTPNEDGLFPGCSQTWQQAI